MTTRPKRLEIYRAVMVFVEDGNPKTEHQWRWRIRAGNGRVLASGEAYRRLIDCAHAVGLVTGLALEGVTPGSDYFAGLYDPDGQPLGGAWRITVSP